MHLLAKYPKKKFKNYIKQASLMNRNIQDFEFKFGFQSRSVTGRGSPVIAITGNLEHHQFFLKPLIKMTT
jgi:hypothetical protein